MRYYYSRILAFIILFVSFSARSSAQFTEAHIGINGLTCSQCTRTVEMRIRKLGFVKDVQMDLQHTEGRITFKANEKADISKLAQAVRDAGFSVRFLKATFNFNTVTLSAHNCFSYSGDTYQFVQAPKPLSAVGSIQFVGKGYVPKKEQNKWQPANGTCSNSSGNLYYIIQ